MPFETLSLDPKIIRSLTEAGYTRPTKIQAQAIPEILNGQDIRGSAQTGTGKTAAFLLPLLNRLVNHRPAKGRGPRALIIVPTRELAMQISEQTQKYSKYLNFIKAVCIYGGTSYHAQERQLAKPYDVLIATPGRLVDYIKQKKINFSRLEMLIFDEADRMLDMGFQDAVELIVASVPKDRQTLLFSATFTPEIHKLSENLLANPVDVVVHHEKEKHENIEQTLHYVDNLGHKNRILLYLLGQDDVQSTIIFTATKRHADVLVRELKECGYRSGALHGDMNQNQRSRTIKKFKEKKLNVLVATDVAARGLDVQHITHVINFDLPRSIEDYVHRIGRTGRAGAHGFAYSFASHQEKGLVKRIEAFTGQPIDVKEIEGYEPTQKQAPKQGRFNRKRKPNMGFKDKKPYGGRFKKSNSGFSKAKPRFGKAKPSFGKPKRRPSFKKARA